LHEGAQVFGNPINRGLTQSAGTAELMARRTPEMPLAPFDPRRF